MTTIDETTTAQTRTHILSYFTALQQRDLPSIVPLFADTVDWHIPGNKSIAPWLGTRTSKAEITIFFQLLWSATEPLSAQLNHMIIHNNVAITSGTFSSRILKTGKIYNSLFFTEITVHNGKISKYRLLEDTLALVYASINES